MNSTCVFPFGENEFGRFYLSSNDSNLTGEKLYLHISSPEDGLSKQVQARIEFTDKILQELYCQG